MASEHINSLNHKIHSYDQIIKMIVNLGNNKCENNNNSTFQLSSLQNSSFMSIVDTPEQDLSNVDLEIRHVKSTYIFNKLIINVILFLNICNEY